MKSIIILVLVLGVAVGGYYVISNNSQFVSQELPLPIPQEQAVVAQQPEDQVAEIAGVNVPTEEAMIKEEEVMVKEEEIMIKEEPVEISALLEANVAEGVYKDYSAELVSQAEGEVVLFFMAAWCPSCRALDGDISAHAQDIPQGVTILKVDYDSSTALKQEYGVTTQHTLVQIDTNGNAIQSWRGGNSLTSIISKL